MGLLTDPRAGTGKAVKLLLRWEKLLCFFLYIGGVLWMMLLALPAFNDNTYFSENALLPGLVTKESNLEQMSKQFYQELTNEMKHYPDNMPYAWLSAKFNQLHLDTFVHNFSIIYPFKKQKFVGQNIYGIVRAPKAASTEAIVVSVPFRPLNSIYLSTAPSVALLLAFAKFCRKQKYWAKDIIFLVTEHEQLGMQAWLDAYHGVTSGQEGVLLARDLAGHAGSIQAAINLELHASKISSIDVKVEGLNGQLPNLDLFNLAQSMIAKEGIQQTFQHRADNNDKNKLNKWWYQFITMSTMIVTQATGIPNGNHGLFHRFGIEAVTLEGFEKTDTKSEANFYQVGRVIESMVRSLNNLLERFHQSYFFYLLPSTDRYISISLYMRPLALIVASLFIKAFAIWQKLQAPILQNDKMSGTNIQNVQIKIFDIGTIASEILWAHIFGVFILLSPPIFTSIGSQVQNFRTEDSIYFGNALATLLMLLWPIYSKRSVKCQNTLLICIIATVELATTLICIAMYNFSLALIAALLYTPAALFSSPRQESSFRSKSLLYALWMILHPFILSSFIIMGYTYVNFQGENFLSLVSTGYRASKQAFVFSIVDSMIYGNWFYSVTTVVMLPIWLLFWNVVCLNNKPRV